MKNKQNRYIILFSRKEKINVCAGEFGLCDEKECISIILDNEEQVNEFMLMLIEKSFIVNCEPRYLGAFYEGSVWCGDEHYLRITTKRVEEK